MLINVNQKLLLEEFLNTYKSTQDININAARNIISNAVKKHSSHKDGESYFKTIEKLWYYSLAWGSPNYGLYNDDYYFTDLWTCWTVYSRKYLKGIMKCIDKSDNSLVFDKIKNYNSVLDLGCGIGLTTSSLAQMFPNAQVFGTNIEDTKQYKFCQLMSRKYGFNIYPDINHITQDIDLVFASEYFEHIENPVEHLKDIIYKLNPKCFIIANAFNTSALGHFIEYKNEGNIINQKYISKIFDSVLKENNYIKLKTNLWNNRPAIWIKK